MDTDAVGALTAAHKDKAGVLVMRQPDRVPYTDAAFWETDAAFWVQYMGFLYFAGEQVFPSQQSQVVEHKL